MDAGTVRANLTELNERMAELKAEEEVVKNLIVGFEGWLRLNISNGRDAKQERAESPTRARTPSIKAASKSPRRTNRPAGAISLNRAVLQVIEQAHGEPLLTTEIYQRAQAMGASTQADKPAGVVDLMLYSHRDRGRKPIERIGTRTWRWIGSPR